MAGYPLARIARLAFRRLIEAGRHPSRRAMLTMLLRLPLIGGLAASGDHALAGPAQPAVAPHRERVIAAIIDRMLPADELPGGLALGIHRRIATTTDPELKRSVAAAVAWLDGQARRQGASSFLRLDQARQDAVLETALTSHSEGARAIVWNLRKQAFDLYYAHPVVMAAFAYSGPPQPTGFPDFQEPPT